MAVFAGPSGFQTSFPTQHHSLSAPRVLLDKIAMIGLGNVALRPLGTSGLRTRLASTPIRSRRAQLAVRPAALSLPDSYG